MTESPRAAEIDRYVRDELPRFIQLIGTSRVRELEIQDGEFGLLIRRGDPESRRHSEVSLVGEEVETLAIVEEHRSNLQIISASMVGTFYLSEHPGGAPLVSEGSHVEPGALIGVIEALQVLTEVESGVSGVVNRILADDAEPVEFGQPLIEVLVDG